MASNAHFVQGLPLHAELTTPVLSPPLALQANQERTSPASLPGHQRQSQGAGRHTPPGCGDGSGSHHATAVLLRTAAPSDAIVESTHLFSTSTNGHPAAPSYSCCSPLASKISAHASPPKCWTTYASKTPWSCSMLTAPLALAHLALGGLPQVRAHTIGVLHACPPYHGTRSALVPSAKMHAASDGWRSSHAEIVHGD